MPNFKVHLAGASLVGLAGAGAGLAYWQLSPTAALWGFLAATTGGLAPDLDAGQSRPLKLTAALTGGALALGAFQRLSAIGWPGAALLGPGSGWARPWPILNAAGAALLAYFLFSALVIFGFRRLTRHRGLWHSLAVPFLVAGLWAWALAGQERTTILTGAVLAGAGVFSHLILDALFSRSLDPLKITTAQKGHSLLMWLATAGVSLAAWW